MGDNSILFHERNFRVGLQLLEQARLLATRKVRRVLPTS
jgi:hypothetical protein